MTRIVAAMLSMFRWPALYAAYASLADVSVAEQAAQFSLFKRVALQMIETMIGILKELTSVVAGL